MNDPKIAVIKSDFHDQHSSAWGHVWIEYCEQQEINYSLIDWRSKDAFRKLINHDIILWHYSHYSNDEMIFAKNILSALKSIGCKVFPDQADSQHFDDKVAQSYFMKALGIDSPENYPLHSLNAVNEWIKEVKEFPVVAKLRTGSGSSNVKLINDKHELKKYAKLMFRNGIKATPSTAFKLKSNLISTKSFDELLSRIKRIPEFLFSRTQAKSLPIEKGYVYLQEFIPNVDYDLKIAVVRNKLSFVARGTRPGEFRASGGGTLFYDKTLVTKDIIDSAFKTFDALGSECTGLDMITDPRSNMPVILEISYGFSHTAQLGAGGYFDRSGAWISEPFNPPLEVLINLIKDFKRN